MTVSIPNPFPSPRFAITAVFAAFGVIGGIWAGAVPNVTKMVGLDGYWLGLAFTGLMLSNVLAMTIGGFLARLVSSRRMLLITLPVMAFAAVLVHSVSALWIFLPALFAFGFSQGLTDLFMNAEGSRIEVELGKPIFSGLHGVVSLAIGICAILGSLIAVGVGPWAATPLFLAAAAFGTWVVARALPERPPVRRAKAAWRAPVIYGPLVLLGLAVGFENAAEIAAATGSAPAMATSAWSWCRW